MGDQENTEDYLIVKEKDYEFYENSRRIKGIPAEIDLLSLDHNELQQILSKKKKKNNRKLNKFGNNRNKLTLGAQRLLEQAQKKFNNKKDINNPLAASNFSKVKSNQSTLKSNPLNPLDPLSRKPKQRDPLSSGRTANPLANNPLAGNPSKLKKSEPIKQQNEPSLLKIKEEEQENKKKEEEGQQEEEQNESNLEQLSGGKLSEEDYWQQIKLEYVKIFGITPSSSKMTQLVVNPFGSAVLKFEDKQIQKKAQQMQMKQEYGNKAQQQAQPGQKEVHKITVKNYLTYLEERYNKMVNRWNTGDKVGALQVTIQQIKLLIENENPKFAPLKYVYVMDILDKFGKNVLDRMKSLAFPDKTEEELQTVKHSDLKGVNISEQTQEIARNWIKKVGSIRELLPRMYIEISLLPIYYYIDPAKIPVIIQRLTKQCRAIGDIINSVYFSTYLLRMFAELIPREKDHILSLIQDFFFYMKQGPKYFGKSNISAEDYFELFQPFLITAFKFYCNQCTEIEFYNLFESYQNSNQHYTILDLIIEIFPTQYIGQYAGLIFQIVQNYHVDIKSGIYSKFLPKISQAVQNRNTLQQICQLVWLDLKEVDDLNKFLNILAALIELVQKAFEGFQKTQFFQDILEKFNQLFTKSQEQGLKNTVNSQIMDKLEQFLINILEGADDVSEIITIDPFIQFLQFFPNDIRPKVSVNVLNIYLQKDESQNKMEDPIVVHSLLNISKNVNQALILTKEYKTSLVKIVNIIINKVDFGRDLEQMLNLYTEVRGNFGNLSEITENLLYKVINLTMKVRVFSKGKITPKVKAFLQACIAFCYITIPTITDIEQQIQFFNLCSQVALNHNLISQAEAIFKTGIQVMTGLPETNSDGKNLDAALQSQMKSMLGFMIVLPDDPEHDYLHLFQGFYKLITVFQWSNKNGELYKLGLLSDFIKYLCVQIQEKLPYHIQNVNSNDQLFVEPEFKKAILDHIQQVLDDIIDTQKAILTRTGFSNDVYTSLDVTKQNLELSNTLLQYFKGNNSKIKEIIRKSLEIVQIKSQILAHDKIGKIQFRTIHSFIRNTFTSIEKHIGEDVCQDYEVIKNNIEKNIQISKSNIF